MTRTGAVAAITALLLATPSPAVAHLVNSGLGPFYDGALHLFLSPGDLLGLTAAALLAGLRSPRAGRQTVLVLPASWFVAGVVGLNLPMTVTLPWTGVLSFVLLGVLVACDPNLPEVLVASLNGMFGLIHGLLNGSALAVIGAGLMSLLGIAATVLVIALLISALVLTMRADWMRIAVRVVGSWVAAVGMLMFGWLMKGAG